MNELLTPEEMGRADRIAIEGGTAGTTLMEAAGLAVADAVAARHPFGVRILALAGPGNNGGDAWVAARILKERGYAVRVMTLGDPERLRGDAAVARSGWRRPVEPADPRAVGAPDVVLDGLFGAGLDRPLEGEAAALVDAVNAVGAHVVAIDLPSGVSGLTGEVLGTAIAATETVTFFRFKPGHFLLPGRTLAGRLRLADIGIPETALETIRPQLFRNRPELWRASVPVPDPSGHKYARGHAVVVSGGVDRTGAARLAAGAALRAGAGLVTLASPPDALVVNASHLTAVMVRAVEDADALAGFLADPRLNAVAVGPGLGTDEAARAKVAAALDGRRAAVLDADAITAFAETPDALFAALAPPRGGEEAGPRAVLTPHEGEFARLFPDLSPGRVAPGISKVERARRAAARAGAVVLLKGADSVIAAPDGRAAINANAPPFLATAGAGDVLTGIVAGFQAQGVPAFEAAAMATWLHGDAARAVGPGLTAEDLDPALRPAIARLLEAAAV